MLTLSLSFCHSEKSFSFSLESSPLYSLHLLFLSFCLLVPSEQVASGRAKAQRQLFRILVFAFFHLSYRVLEVSGRLLSVAHVKLSHSFPFASYFLSIALIFNWLQHHGKKAPPLNVLLTQLKAAAVPISNLMFGTWDWLPPSSKTASSTECGKAWKHFLACFS